MTLQLTNGKTLHGEGKGTVRIQFENDKARCLHDVKYIPALDHSRLSVGMPK